MDLVINMAKRLRVINTLHVYMFLSRVFQTFPIILNNAFVVVFPETKLEFIKYFWELLGI